MKIGSIVYFSFCRFSSPIFTVFWAQNSKVSLENAVFFWSDSPNSGPEKHPLSPKSDSSSRDGRPKSPVIVCAVTFAYAGPTNVGSW